MPTTTACAPADGAWRAWSGVWMRLGDDRQVRQFGTDPPHQFQVGPVGSPAFWRIAGEGGPNQVSAPAVAGYLRVGKHSAVGQHPRTARLDQNASRRGAGNPAGLWGSLVPAAWSFMLAARARGLGTAWTTLQFRYEAEISALLGLPQHVRQGVLIPTGYYTGTTFRPAPRLPLDEVLHLDGW